MRAGRPPFVGDDGVAIISQHLNTRPIAPSWHNPEVAPDLEGLVLELSQRVALLLHRGNPLDQRAADDLDQALRKVLRQ